MSVYVRLFGHFALHLHLRKLAIVQNLVFEVAELLNDLLTLGLRLRVVGLGDGTVNVVDSTRLRTASVNALACPLSQQHVWHSLPE